MNWTEGEFIAMLKSRPYLHLLDGPETEEDMRHMQEMAELASGVPVDRNAQPNKYGANRTVYNGRAYASKKEARYAQELDLRRQAGEIRGYIEQVPFRLPGGVVHRVDFGILELDGTITWVEVKGRDLPMGKLKRRQVEELFAIQIEVV